MDDFSPNPHHISNSSNNNNNNNPSKEIPGSPHITTNESTPGSPIVSSSNGFPLVKNLELEKKQLEVFHSFFLLFERISFCSGGEGKINSEGIKIS